MDTQDPPPWGVAIEAARKAKKPKMSMRKAAELAGMSEGRWRQITKGYQATGGGHIPVPGPAETVARMAQVVGLTDHDLEDAQRPDAAEVVRAHRAEYPDNPELVEALVETDSIFEEMREWLSAAPNGTWPGRPPSQGLAFWSTEQLLEALAEREQGHREAITYHVQRYERLRLRYETLQARVSAASDNIPHLIAAHEEEGPISGEQEESDTP